MWKVSGEQGAEWLRADVDLPTNGKLNSVDSFQLAFSARIEDSPGKFALDDFSLTEGTCSQVLRNQNLPVSPNNSTLGADTRSSDALCI